MFPEIENGDGDMVAHNAVAVNTGSQWTKRVSTQFEYHINDPDTDHDAIKAIDGAARFRDFQVGDVIVVSGYTDPQNNGTFSVTAITGSNANLEFEAVGGGKPSGTGDENSGGTAVITIERRDSGHPHNEVAGFGFASEGTDTGALHEDNNESETTHRWGAGMYFAEDTNGNNTGTWMPSTNTRYKFYITTVYDDGTQESLPQLMAMYDAGALVANSSDDVDLNFQSPATSDIYFTKGVPIQDRTVTTSGVKGEQVALHLKPVIKITGALHSDTDRGNYAFGAVDVDDTTGGNPRISGVRIYWASSEDGYSELWRIFDCDFFKGTKTYGMDSPSGTGGWAPWQHISLYPSSTLKAADGHYMIPDWNTGNKFTSPPKFLSYFTANGHSHNEDIVLNSFKSAVVANNRVYAGNVNQTVDGQPTQFSDRIMKSPIGQFDKFPASNYLQAAKNDGDEIVALATFGDRLLQFNKNVMYIINISQVDEFMESEHKFKGIASPASVFTTDKGIAWANKLGAYFYDGNRVHNLLRRKETSLISQSTWSTFADTAIMTGYISSKNQLIFGADIGTGDGSIDGEAYIYSLTTRSWVRASTGTVADAIKTNFTSDYNGDLIYYDYTAEKMLKWDSAPDSSDYLNMLTKDIDFGQPSVRKKIYKVYISYKGDASAVTLNYSVDGKNDVHAGQFYRIGSTGASTGATASDTPFYGSTVGTDNWVNAEFKPTAAINDIYSFQLKLDGEGAADFEINDISIVYRMKSIK